MRERGKAKEGKRRGRERKIEFGPPTFQMLPPPMITVTPFVIYRESFSHKHRLITFRLLTYLVFYPIIPVRNNIRLLQTLARILIFGAHDIIIE